MSGSGSYRHLEEFQPDFGESALVEAESASYFVRDVQATAVHIGTAVVNPDDKAPVVLRVRYPDDGAEG
jgi:hypothetical protein